MAISRPVQGLREPLPATRKINGWHLAAAVLFIALGMLAIIEPSLAALAFSRFFAWMLILGGAVHLFGACEPEQILFERIVGVAYTRWILLSNTSHIGHG